VDPEVRLKLSKTDISAIEPLHHDFLDKGRRLADLPTIEQIRKLRDSDLGNLKPGVKKLVDPEPYPVFLSQGLWELKEELLRRYRKDE
jgi:nicotinate phosphoribosyltransferase